MSKEINEIELLEDQTIMQLKRKEIEEKSKAHNNGKV